MQQIQIWLQPQSWLLWQIYRIMMRWWCLMMSMNLSNYRFVLFLCFLNCITFSFFSYVLNTNLSHNTNILQWVCLSQERDTFLRSFCDTLSWLRNSLTASPSAWQQTRERRHTLPPHFLLCLLHLLWICLWHIVGNKKSILDHIHVKLQCKQTSKARKMNVLAHETIECSAYKSRVIEAYLCFPSVWALGTLPRPWIPPLDPSDSSQLTKWRKALESVVFLQRLNQKEKKKRLFLKYPTMKGESITS